MWPYLLQCGTVSAYVWERNCLPRNMLICREKPHGKSRSECVSLEDSFHSLFSWDWTELVILGWLQIQPREAATTLPGTAQGPCGPWEVIATGLECSLASWPEGHVQRLRGPGRTPFPLSWMLACLGPNGGGGFRWGWLQCRNLVSGEGCPGLATQPVVPGKDFLEAEEEQVWGQLLVLSAAASWSLSYPDGFFLPFFFIHMVSNLLHFRSLLCTWVYYLVH